MGSRPQNALEKVALARPAVALSRFADADLVPWGQSLNSTSILLSPHVFLACSWPQGQEMKAAVSLKTRHPHSQSGETGLGTPKRPHLVSHPFLIQPELQGDGFVIPIENIPTPNYSSRGIYDFPYKIT